MLAAGIAAVAIMFLLTSKVNNLNDQLAQAQRLIDYRTKEIHKLKAEEACRSAAPRLRIITNTLLKLKPVSNQQYYKVDR